MPSLKNSNLQIDLDVTNGIAITRIFDVVGGRDYLSGPSSFFKFAVNNGQAFTSDQGVTVYSVIPGFSTFTVGARSNDGQVDFVLTTSLTDDSAAAIFGLTVTNMTVSDMFLRVVMPCILNVRTPGDPANMMGMISTEAGAVVPLSAASVWGTPVTPLGMPFIVDVGLPNSHNNMELASIFDSAIGGGVFFCDIEGDLDNGVAPLQFTLDRTIYYDQNGQPFLQFTSDRTVIGFWTGNIPANSRQNSMTLPRMAIGVHPDGDWHRAVDFYTAVHRPRWTFPSTPAWLSDAGAIYSPAGGGAGGIYLSLPPMYLSKVEGKGSGRISSFLELPNLLSEANALGTNILHLVDYWESAGDGLPYYWNKGDYIPRSDLGGECALRDGIDAVHQQNGRVLLYLEPFTVYKNSKIGQSIGSSWGGRDWSGKLWGLQISDKIYPNYPDNYEMVAPFPEWQTYMADTAVRLVRDYHADGIFLDSYAWQMNRPMQVKIGATTFTYTAQEYARGVLTVVQNIRTAIQQVNTDAVVIGECTAGPIARYWDGGLNADLGFGNIWPCPDDSQKARGVQRLTASPVRYGIPEVRMFGNGWTLNGLHQFFAAGHGLALCSNYPGGGFLFDNADHIRRLVEIRKTYGDALIYGAQINQPRTDNTMVIAYQYQGSSHRILTIVNISDTNVEASISLDTPDPGGRWRDLFDQGLGRYYYAKNGVLENVVLTTGPGSILVLENVYNPFDKEPSLLIHDT